MTEIRYCMHPMRREDGSMTANRSAEPKTWTPNPRQIEVLNRYQLLTEELARLCPQIKGVEIIVTE